MEPNAAVARRFYQAMHGSDVPGLLATLSDDFVAHVSDGLPGGYGGTYVGGQQMLADCWLPVHLEFGALPHPARYLVAEPDHVVVIGEYQGTARATRRKFTAAFAHVLRLAAGRIVELRQITDTAQWAAALSNIDVARAVFDAVRARDLQALLGAYSDEIVIRDDPSLSYGGEHRGVDGAISHAAGFARAWDPYQSAEDRDPREAFLEVGNQIVAIWRLRASRAQHRLDQATVSVLTIAEGAVVALEMFHHDTKELLAFLDGPPIDPESIPV